MTLNLICDPTTAPDVYRACVERDALHNIETMCVGYLAGESLPPQQPPRPMKGKLPADIYRISLLQYILYQYTHIFSGHKTHGREWLKTVRYHKPSYTMLGLRGIIYVGDDIHNPNIHDTFGFLMRFFDMEDHNLLAMIPLVLSHKPLT